jgi:hypothetical protein
MRSGLTTWKRPAAATLDAQAHPGSTQPLQGECAMKLNRLNLSMASVVLALSTAGLMANQALA